MNGLLGKKIGMACVFSEDGSAIPVTMIEAGPCYVTQQKTVETDVMFPDVVFGNVMEG